MSPKEKTVDIDYINSLILNNTYLTLSKNQTNVVCLFMLIFPIKISRFFDR